MSKLKTKVTREQFELLKALRTGKRGAKVVDIVLGIPIFEIEEYDVEAELLEKYEIIDSGDKDEPPQ